MISVQELFYSRVEASYSLTGKSGYQVVYHSPGLAAALVREVETQLRCFSGKEVEIRYQFFHLSTGQVAVAACQNLDEIDTQIVDRAGRSGPFIAHALVIEADVFEMLESNPFWLIDFADPFVLDVPTMIETQQSKPIARIIEFDVPDAEARVDYTVFDIQDWKLADFTALWLATASARDLVARGQVIGLQSEEAFDIIELLRLLFAHLSPVLRSALTFNTFVDNCQPLPGIYWAMGGYRRNPLSGAIHVRLDRRTLDYRAFQPDRDIELLAEQVYQRLRIAQGLADEQ